MGTIRKTAVYKHGLVNKALLRIDYSDAFRGEYKASSNPSLETIAQLFFNSSSSWARTLLNLRNILLCWSGLITRSIPTQETAVCLRVGERAGLFRLFARSDNELLFGEDDKHLNVRMILKNSKQTITITTLVQFNNRWGKLYFQTIRFFHQQIMKSQLKKLIKKLNINEDKRTSIA
ncbi:DUF2867 domain-containing protein [Legionella sp. km772]|uniref:DUF2867 domain-containing protein n=1 Tax=Legionella sp. km772 TaxID=2498111 RepID=UPI000F8C4886|nr:DUF2867 domain-containing protein [Legionella sp. km772]RUR06251.1 DUF2867 domain-containing protein [Legionella sp. km772]